MTEDAQHKELYDARNDHEVRISLMEVGITDIKSGIGELQETMTDFVSDINGIPKKNAEAIDGLGADIDILSEDIGEMQIASAERTGFLKGIDKATVFYISLLMALGGIGGFLINHFIIK